MIGPTTERWGQCVRSCSVAVAGRSCSQSLASAHTAVRLQSQEDKAVWNTREFIWAVWSRREPTTTRTKHENCYCKLPTLSDNHFAPDLRDRHPSSPRPRSGARFCACFSLPTFATGGGAFQERGMCPYLLSLKVGSLRYKIRLYLRNL